MMLVIDCAIDGSSPKLSYVRPHRSLRATHRHGANVQSMPVPATSSATVCPICCTSAGSRVAPSPFIIAVRWKLSYMSAQDDAVLVAGAEPPPDSSEPRLYVTMSCWIVRY